MRILVVYILAKCVRGSVEIIGLGEFMVGRCIGKKDGRGKKWVRQGV